jgi:hypothetical protein
LVRWVAAESDLDIDLGDKGESGILHSQASRAAFLSDPDPSHRLSLHTQALLLAQPDRNLAEHSHPQTTQAWLIPSRDELKAKVLAFIEYYNRTMAKPFKWTYQGKPLVA